MGFLYGLTLLLNALLLFLVQPMIAKMLLPYLGGTPVQMKCKKAGIYNC